MTGQAAVKTFPLKMTPEFNQKLRVVAAKKDTSIQAYIMKAVEDRLKKDGVK